MLLLSCFCYIYTIISGWWIHRYIQPRRTRLDSIDYVNPLYLASQSFGTGGIDDILSAFQLGANATCSKGPTFGFSSVFLKGITGQSKINVNLFSTTLRDFPRHRSLGQ